jgi:predicted SAM-dependent methyltransferase
MKLDLGCGTQKKGVDWIGCDVVNFPGVDRVFNVGSDPWPFEDDSVDEAHCSHVLEHLTNFNGLWERIYFFNQLYRVLKPDAKCQLVFPHWCSTRYYGDPTHKEPFSEMGFYYLSRDWRRGNAPHCDSEQTPGPQSYTCNFEASWGYSFDQKLLTRNDEYKQYALSNYKEAAQDLIATVIKRVPKAA